jgi:hypothetical protein
MNTVLNFNAVGFTCLFLCGLCFLLYLVQGIVDPFVTGRIISPKDVYDLMPNSVNTQHGKRELRQHVELRLLIS